MSNDDTLQDEMWYGIDTDPLVVPLEDDWATEHQLPLSVSGFHGILKRKKFTF